MSPELCRTWARALLATAAALVAFTAAVAPAYAADDDQSGGFGISVTVIAPATTTSGTTTSGMKSNGAAVKSSASAPSTVNTAATASEPAESDVAIAGGLFLSDIEGESRPTLNPFEGKSELWITLRNRSTDTLDLTADFSLATFYGARIDGDEVRVSALKPGETRVVGTTLRGSGQWPFVVGRVTIVPPDTISGQQTAPVSRATVVYVFPWLLLIALVLVVVALILLRLSTSFVRATPFAGAPA